MREHQPPRHVEIGDIWVDVSIRESHSATAEVSDHPVEEGSAITDHVRPLPRTIEIEGLVTNHPLELPLSHAGNARVSAEKIALRYAANPLPRIAPNTQQIEGEPDVGLLGVVPGVDQGVALLGALRLDVRSKRRFSADRYTVDQLATTNFSASALHFTEEFNRVEEVHQALLQIIDESLLVRVYTALMVYPNVALSDLSIERSGTIGRNALKFSATGRVLRIVSSETVALPNALATQSKGKQDTLPADPNNVPLPNPIENNDAFNWSGFLGDLLGGH